jgi:chemotaxis protein methyltransferase CheR
MGPAVPGHHWTLQAHLLLERGDAVGALAAVDRALTRDSWSADAWLLRGRIARLQGDPNDAIRHFRQVVYSAPECWPAHYHLAELYRDRGKIELAVREYRIVLRQLADREQAIRTAGTLPLAMSIQDLRFLCEMQLSRLGQARD